MFTVWEKLGLDDTFFSILMIVCCKNMSVQLAEKPQLPHPEISRPSADLYAQEKITDESIHSFLPSDSASARIDNLATFMHITSDNDKWAVTWTLQSRKDRLIKRGSCRVPEEKTHGLCENAPVNPGAMNPREKPRRRRARSRVKRFAHN